MIFYLYITFRNFTLHFKDVLSFVTLFFLNILKKFMIGFKESL